MLGLNGLELVKKVKSSNSNLRMILRSAYNFEDESELLITTWSLVISSSIIIHIYCMFRSIRTRILNGFGGSHSATVLIREPFIFLNLVGVYETQIDENQNFSYKVWEWK